jgi:hypothetical protein
MRSPSCLCVCASPPKFNFRMPEPILKKVCSFFMANEPISTAFVTNPPPLHFVCTERLKKTRPNFMRLYSLNYTSYMDDLHNIWMRKFPSVIAGKESKTFSSGNKQTQQQKNSWTRHFLCNPCLIKWSLWVCLCNLLSLLGNNSIKTLPRQLRSVGDVVFLCGPCRIKGK